VTEILDKIQLIFMLSPLADSSQHWKMWIEFYFKAVLITASHFRPRDNGPEGMEPDGIIEVGV